MKKTTKRQGYTALFTILCLLLVINANLKAQENTSVKQILIDRLEETMNSDELSIIKQFNDNENFFYRPNLDKNQLSNLLKTITTTEDVLDSIIYFKAENHFKDVYTFDVGGNKTAVQFYAQDSVSDEWIKYGKFSYSYDDNGQLLTSYAELFDTDDETWQAFALITNIYDDNENLLSLVQEGLDGNGDWTNTNSKVYTYDDNNYRLTAFDYSWNSVSETWILGFGGFFTYDNNGNPLTAEYKHNNGSSWDILFRYKYVYDDNDYTISIENNKYNSVNATWVDHLISLYSNNDQGEPTEVIDKLHNGSEWININKTKYTYDENGDKLIGLGQVWSETEWINSGQQIFTYDDSHHFLTFQLQSWNSTDVEWNNILLFSYSYTENGNLKDFTSKKWDGNEWKLGDSSFWFIINETRYSYDGHQLTAYYHLITVDLINIDDLQITVFPNPVTNGELNIVLDFYKNDEGLSVSLFDISGKQMHSASLKNTFGLYQISGLENVRKGIYILSVSNSTMSKTFKIYL